MSDRPADPRAVVYYMTSEHRGVVKIGTTVDLQKRIERFNRDLLGRAKGVQCRAIAAEPGDARLESQRHREFAASYLIGEWYWLTPDLVEHIESLGGML